MKTKNYSRLITSFSVVIIFMLLTSCQKENNKTVLKSPDEKLSVTLISADNGKLAYTLDFNSAVLIDTSFVGFEFQQQVPLAENLEIVGGFRVLMLTKAGKCLGGANNAKCETITTA